jgi:hypothetical protein
MKLFCNFPKPPAGNFYGAGCCGTVFQASDNTSASGATPQQILESAVKEHIRRNHTSPETELALLRAENQALKKMRDTRSLLEVFGEQFQTGSAGDLAKRFQRG